MPLHRELRTFQAHGPPSTAVEVRGRLHRYPEPYWRESHTTSIMVDELERISVDEIHVGPDALAVGERLGVPDGAALREWRDREHVLAVTEGGATGFVGVVR